MIIRILGEGQYEVPDAQLDRLNTLDSRLQAAAEHDDQTGFAAALSDLLAAVRSVGTVLPDSALTGSDLILPTAGAGLHEVLALLADDGLIPG